jgi:hypothetical protein
MLHAWYSDNVNDNTDNYLLLINGNLLDCELYRQVTIRYSLWVSWSAYFHIHFQLCLLWVLHKSLETYSWIIYKCTILISICLNIIFKKKICRHRDSNLQHNIHFREVIVGTCCAAVIFDHISATLTWGHCVNTLLLDVDLEQHHNSDIHMARRTLLDCQCIPRIVPFQSCLYFVHNLFLNIIFQSCCVIEGTGNLGFHRG